MTCVQLVVDNEGSVTGSLTRTGATQDGTLTVSGARADVLVNGGPCGIQNVNVTPLSGPVDGDPAVNLASLDTATATATATAFNVPGFSGCGAFQNFILNAFFDVPANNGDLQMDLAISAT